MITQMNDTLDVQVTQLIQDANLRTTYQVKVNNEFLCNFDADEDGFVTSCFIDHENFVCFDMNTKPGWSEKMDQLLDEMESKKEGPKA